MDWHSPIKLPQTIKKADTPEQKVSAFLKEVTNNYRHDSKYKPKVRFSKLPICPLLFAQELLDQGPKKAHFSLDFFGTVGTAVHDTYQMHAPLTKSMKQYVFGDWKCSKCEKVTVQRACTPEGLICPVCRSNEPTLTYSEIEVNYKGVTGHLDMILLIDGVYYLLDFKTTSLSNIQEPSKYLPHSKHLMQIESYVYAMQYQFEINIEHYCLVYVSRDSTDLEGAIFDKNHRWIYHRETSPKMLKIRHAQLEGAVRTKRLVKKFINDPTPKTLKALDENRPCRTKEDYKNNQTGMTHAFVMKECPYLASCCGTPKYTKAARAVWAMVDEDE